MQTAHINDFLTLIDVNAGTCEVRRGIVDCGRSEHEFVEVSKLLSRTFSTRPLEHAWLTFGIGIVRSVLFFSNTKPIPVSLHCLCKYYSLCNRLAM